MNASKKCEIRFARSEDRIKPRRSVAAFAGFLFVGAGAYFAEAAVEGGFGEEVGSEVRVVGAGIVEGLEHAAAVAGADGLQRGLDSIEGMEVGVGGDFFDQVAAFGVLGDDGVTDH